MVSSFVHVSEQIWLVRLERRNQFRFCLRVTITVLFDEFLECLLNDCSESERNKIVLNDIRIFV